jgi:hypothetical protein
VSAVALCCATAARADGDPASDFLPVQNVFTPFDTKIPQPLVGQLTALVNEANARGFKLKVAVIATTYDLGAVPSLFDKPKRYARFLGQELYLMYNGRLLIVMPNGYGLYRHGKPVAAEQRLLDTLPPPGTTGTALVTSAEHAVLLLARHARVDLTLPQLRATPRSNQTRDRLVILAGALILGGIAALAVVARRVLGRNFSKH